MCAFGLVPHYLRLESTDGQTVKVDFNPSSGKFTKILLKKKDKKLKICCLFWKRNNVSESAYRELTVFCDGLPRTSGLINARMILTVYIILKEFREISLVHMLV